MPTGNDPLKAAQIVTQRVSVEPPARRDAAEPIGRAFADLVAEARAIEDRKPGEQAAAPDSERDEQYAFSAALPEDEDASAFLVANAALSDTSQPVAGLLRHGPAAPAAPPPQQAGAPPQAAPTDLLVDTSALFLPPDPNQPIQTSAAIHSTQFTSLSWPLPESAGVLQAVAAAGATQQSRPGAHLNVPAGLTAPETATPNLAAAEGGPGANRQNANLSVPASIDLTSATNASSASTPSSGAQAGTQSANGPNAGTGQPPAPQVGAPSLALDAGSLPTPGAMSQTAAIPGAATSSATPPTMASGASTAAHSPPPALASAPQAAIQVYSRFVERFDGRAQQYQIRLDPPELGRVNVRIEIGADHRVHAVLATHDSNALSDLLRGQRALEQSLADAGIDLAEDGIRFELSDGGAQQSAPGERDETSGTARATAAAAAIDSNENADQGANPATRWSRSRINIVA